MGDWKRTATCGELTASGAGSSQTLMGWVKSIRDHGGVIFADLRDRYGVTQVVFRPETLPGDQMEQARQLSFEYVVAVRGTVELRPDGMRNPDMHTGEVELLVAELKMLNRAEPLPFLPAEEPSASEELRLKHRYLDLRREACQKVFALRHGIYQSVRKCLSEEGFLEIETPILVRPTPEGARDFLVPSRVHRGKFFALPQSPQLYKQLLMVSGFDRYFQLARCLRDEDLRADRQPEHTQIDLEMSFCSEEDVFGVVERTFSAVFEENLGVRLPVPFPRLTYDEAMSRFGTDKPDLRIPVELADLTEASSTSGFSLLEEAVKAGGRVACLLVPLQLSRKDIGELETLAKAQGATALFWARSSGTDLEGGVSKSVGGALQKRLLELSQGPGTVLLTAGARAFEAAGAVRSGLGEKLRPGDSAFRFGWVKDFPVFSWSEEDSRWEPTHHMFSMPREEHLEFMEEDPARVRGRVYDLVCDGVELGSGSMRIHSPELQVRVMKVVGLSLEEARRRFGFLLEAMRFGAPPHGGIALGLDRIVMLMAGRDTIRDTIAFPKTTSASSLMDGSPCQADEKDLKELGIKLV
ncbi:MAG: aspartate--tRNA ligase [Candidatus Eiseniibacteriota bacterium]|nr:MAG: aspartate--tRNA ligase [Candidatus Eisenbacteria bacterium]